MRVLRWPLACWPARVPRPRRAQSAGDAGRGRRRADRDHGRQAGARAGPADRHVHRQCRCRAGRHARCAPTCCGCSTPAARSGRPPATSRACAGSRPRATWCITKPGETATGNSGVYDLIDAQDGAAGRCGADAAARTWSAATAWTSTCNTSVSTVTSASRPAAASRGKRVRALFVPEQARRPERGRRTGRPGQRAARRPPRRHRPRPPAVAGPPSRPRGARHLAKHYRGRTVLRDVSLTVHRGEAVGLLGPERRRQDHLLLHHHRPDRRRRRAGAARRPGHHAAADVPARPARHRLPAAGGLDLPRPQRRGQYPRRAARSPSPTARSARPTLERLLAEFALAHLRRVAGAGAVGRRAAAGRDRPGAGRRARASSCWTSRWPGSTRSMSARSAIWSAISRIAASAC